MSDEDQILNKWLSGEISDKEISADIDQETLAKYQQILGEVDRWTPDNTPLAFDRESFTAKRSAKVIALNTSQWLSIAASIVLISFLSFWWLNNQSKSEYVADAGETLKIDLPDGSSYVTLSSGASVKWNDDEWETGNRSLSLDGKAFFDVSPGAFLVKTSTGSVDVLGTTFEVFSFEKSLEIICFTGKVRGTATDLKTQIISAGEAALFHDGNWEEKQSIAANEPAWLTGKFDFSNAPLSQVIKSLEDQYEIVIEDKVIDTTQRFTGSIPTDNLNAALKLVFDPFGITYLLKDKKLTLSK
ncbi:MAG: transmembrane sensor [Marinoscillum sp.]|jgi:transmembrane sensor